MLEELANQSDAVPAITDQPSVPGLEGFVRLSSTVDDSVERLGPLAALVGTWIGNTGWNMIALPQGNGFILLVRPFIETITFRPLGAEVPNRQGQGKPTLLISGLSYDLRVNDAQTNQPMHIENGMWLILNQGDPQNPIISRHATIPHGDSVCALGNFSVINGAPPIKNQNGLPKPGPKTPLGYLDQYSQVKPPFQPSNTVSTLQDVLKKQTISQTVTIAIDSNNNGGVVNIPFVVKHADTKRFQCIFWIETVNDPQNPKGSFLQLQYFQQTDLFFLPTFGGPPGSLIMWPHTNVNTLVKQ